MSLKAILKGFIVSALITLIVILIAAVLLCYTDIDDSAAGIAVYIGTASGVITGSIGTAREAGRKVLINCMAFAIVYLSVMALATFLVKGGIAVNYHFGAVVAGVLACAVFGAVVGRANV